jgi:hypothetical protein
MASYRELRALQPTEYCASHLKLRRKPKDIEADPSIHRPALLVSPRPPTPDPVPATATPSSQWYVALSTRPAPDSGLSHCSCPWRSLLFPFWVCCLTPWILTSIAERLRGGIASG